MGNRNGDRKRWGKRIGLSILAVIGALAVAGCAAEGGGTGELAAAAEEGVKTVRVQPIAKMPVSGPIEQVADVVASGQVDIIAKTSADVVEVLAERGARVQKGDVLIRLDDTDAKLALDQARLAHKNAKQALETGTKQWRNNVERMEQALTEATRFYNKTRNDYDRGLVDKSELDQAENAYTNTQRELELLKETSVTALELQVENAQLALEMAERSLLHHEIKAPIDGVITHLDVQAGMTVMPGVALGTIQQLDPIKIKAYLTEEAAKLARNKNQLKFRISGDPAEYAGEVAYLSEVMDPHSNAYELNLSVANPDLALKPGMKVQVRLTDEEEQLALAVPTLSIVREGTDTYVFVYNEGKAERRKVELGRLNELDQEVLSGVREGELLIVTGQHQLSDGEPVAVEQDESSNGGA